VPESLAVLYAVCIALAVVGLGTRDESSTLRWGLFAVLIAAGYATLRALERRAARRDSELSAHSDVAAAIPPNGMAEEGRRIAG
jgi:hypothetical protein